MRPHLSLPPLTHSSLQPLETLKGWFRGGGQIGARGVRGFQCECELETARETGPGASEPRSPGSLMTGPVKQKTKPETSLGNRPGNPAGERARETSPGTVPGNSQLFPNSQHKYMTYITIYYE